MMHLTTPSPVLLVEDSKIASLIDIGNPASLPVLWSVAAKGSGIMEKGKRMENFWWRVWSKDKLREQHDRKHSHYSPPSQPIRVPTAASASTAPTKSPALSHSVESAASMESFSTNAGNTEGMPECTSTLGIPCPAESIITSDTLQNLVMSIKTTHNNLNGPLSPLPSPVHHHISTTTPSNSTEPSAPTPRPSSPHHTAVESSASTIDSRSTDSAHISPHNASDTSSASVGSNRSIVRGFRPGDASGISTYHSQTRLAPSAASPTPVPILKSSANRKPTSLKKKVGVFEIGSGDSSDGSTAMQEQASPKSPQYHNRSSSLKKRPHFGKKQTSFKEDVTEIQSKHKTTFQLQDDDDGGAIESDTEDEDDNAIEDDDDDEEDVSESAIDEDDDAWEDEGEAESDEPQPLTFHRVSSKPNLTSRRSMLAEGLHQGDRAANLMASAASAPHLRRSRTSTPNGPSMPASPTEDSPLTSQTSQAPALPQFAQGGPQPHYHPPMPPMSSRQTRATMINAELDVNLRKDILNERKTRFHLPMPKKTSMLPGRAFQSSVDMVARAGSSDNRIPGSDHNPELSYYDDHSADLHRTGW